MTLGPYVPDPRDFFVEWQIPDKSGSFIDLAAGGDSELHLAEEAQVGTTSGR